MSTPPLQWSIDVHSLHSPATFTFEANKHELLALKQYAEVEDVTTFNSQLKVVPLAAGKVRVTGDLKAALVQASVVDLNPVPASIEESFAVEYWPDGTIEKTEDNAVPFEEDLPEPIVGGRIPIGEFLAELFSVSLDPYPRNAGDTFEWSAGSEPQTTPFAELARLRREKKPDG